MACAETVMMYAYEVKWERFTEPILVNKCTLCKSSSNNNVKYIYMYGTRTKMLV